MNRKKAALLLIACLACALLTGCHTNTDPWPTSSGSGQAGIVDASATENPSNGSAVPETTQAAQEEHLEVPQETVAPGFNG